ncbi:MAG: hypothetical protein KJ737_07615 [Proteobacteria bacterium]|nr:hypothetical protein [Pseudomonadota bacterium]
MMRKPAVFVAVILGIIFSAISSMADLGDVNIHGFISQGYLQSTRYNHYFAETEDGTFQFNDMGLNFLTQPADNLRLGMQFFAKDLGEFGNDEIVIDWAFADYRYRNWLGIKVGKFKLTGAIYNAGRDVDTSRACIFLPHAIYDENNRESMLSHKGIGIYGQLPFNVEYNFSYGVLNIPENGSVVTRTASEVGGVAEGVDIDASYMVSLFWNTPLEGLRIGGIASDYSILLYTAGPDIKPFGERYYASVEYTYNDFLLAAEWTYGEDKLKIMNNGASIFNIKRYSEGWYVMASYRFIDWFECGGYYSIFYPDRNDQDGTAQKVLLGGDGAEYWLEDVTVFTRFDINASWIAKFEVHSINGLMNIDFSEVSNPANPRKDSVLFAAKMTYVF